MHKIGYLSTSHCSTCSIWDQVSYYNRLLMQHGLGTGGLENIYSRSAPTLVGRQVSHEVPTPNFELKLPFECPLKPDAALPQDLGRRGMGPEIQATHQKCLR